MSFIRPVMARLALTLSIAAPCIAPGALAQNDDDGKPGAQQDSAQATAEPAETTDLPAALPVLEPIMEQVSEIRGLPFIAPVPAEEQSMDDFKEMMMQEIEKEYGDGEEFNDIVDGLMRLGLLKERIELDEAFVSAIASQAAAYYDPETGKFFYLYTDVAEEVLREFAAHELVHALQDQHFDLDGIEEELLDASDHEGGPRNDDYILAVRCLIEGEATYVMNLYSMGEDGGNMMTDMMAKVSLNDLIEMSKLMLAEGRIEGDMAEAMESMDELPNYIMLPMAAAYMSGAGLAKHLYIEGGWEALAGAWANRPPSTELCLHPEKYTADEVDLPTIITLPEFAYLEEAGWTMIDSAIHGEFYLGLLLREHGVSDRDARVASYGWDGDVYQAWRNEAGDVAIILATTWDRERDAEQFYEAYLTASKQKYPEAPLTDEMLDAANREQAGDVVMRSTYFICGDGLGSAWIVNRGAHVFAVEGFDEATVNRITEELETMRIDRIDSVPRAEAFPNEVVIRAAVDAKAVALDGFSFTPDANWQKVEPASQMRVAQYDLPAVEGDSEPAQFVIFFFGDGHGGTYEANLERWKGQFADASEPVMETIDANGITIRTFDISGRYVAETAPGSGERLDKPDQRMIAAVIESSPGPCYLKVVGPRRTMDHWEESIRAMIESIRRP